MPTPSDERLPELAKLITVPNYDRAAISTGIVHFGVGGFHRSHQAMYIDRLLSEGKAFDWGICGVGVLAGDQRLADVMGAQDCLYTLVLKHPDGTLEPRLIGSIVDYLFAPDDPEAVIAKLADPATKIVSLTVTEGGYSVNDATGEFDASGADITADLQPDAVPGTALGLIVAGLDRRRRQGTEPFTVMSCDNIQSNGQVAKTALVSFARLKDPDLASWISDTVAFPNSMVDRITPVTTDEDRAELAEKFDVTDGWPVVAEPFTQWVLEEAFGNGRPPLEDVGVQVVDDVEPFELMKLRLLNAGHQVISYLGYLSGYRYAHEVCQDPLFADFLLDYMVEEGTPTLPEVPGVDLDAYRHELVSRFSSPAVRDTLLRLTVDGSERLPKFLIPVIRERHAAGRRAQRAITTIAAWAVFLEGVDEQGEPIDITERRLDQLQAALRRQAGDPMAFISQQEIFGDLGSDAIFVDSYLRQYALLKSDGARATVARQR